MNVLDRVRATLLRREIAALQKLDHAERDQVQTTDNMMVRLVERAASIVTLQNKLRALEGWSDTDAGGTYGSRLPSTFFIPSKQNGEQQ